MIPEWARESSGWAEGLGGDDDATYGPHDRDGVGCPWGDPRGDGIGDGDDGAYGDTDADVFGDGFGHGGSNDP